MFCRLGEVKYSDEMILASCDLGIKLLHIVGSYPLMHNSDESTVCEEGRSVTWFLYLPGRKSPHVYVVICLIVAVFYAFPAYFFCIITLADKYHVITERWQPHIA